MPTYSKSVPQSFTGAYEFHDSGITHIVNPITLSWTNSLVGERKVDWKKLIARGEDATTPMTAYRSSVRHLDGLHKTVRKFIPTGVIVSKEYRGICSAGLAFDGEVFTAISLDSVTRDASSKFYARAYAAQTQLMSGVLVGELRETLTMIRGRGGKMVDLIRVWSTAVRRLSYRDKGLLRALADLHLEFMFGWRPLANDISGAMDAWKKPRKEITRVSSSADKDSPKSIASGTTGGFGCYYDVTSVVTTQAVVRMRGGVKVITSGHGRNVQAFGLNIQSFVPTIYELIPWSFLVDYFTDLGGTINAIAFPKGDLAWCSTSKRVTFKTLVTTSNTRPGGDPTNWLDQEIVSQPQVTELLRSQLTRVVGAPPIPAPTLRLPTSLVKWANLAALAVSGMSRGTTLRF